MIGIDPQKEHCTLAIFRGTRPEILGTGRSFDDLAGMMAENGAAKLEETLVVIAVPVWYHDGQRQEIMEMAQSAGMTNTRLVNRSAAAAFAYSALQPSDRSMVMVLEMEGGCFEVSVLALTRGGFEVLSADGHAGLEPASTSVSELFSVIDAPIRRTLETAAVEVRELDEIILSGQDGFPKGLGEHIFKAYGHEISTRVKPEEAVALGAAVYGKLIDMGL